MMISENFVSKIMLNKVQKLTCCEIKVIKVEKVSKKDFFNKKR